VENERFETLVRGLGHGASRRGALGLLAALAGLRLGTVTAKAKVTICHHDQTADTWRPIRVGNKTAGKHVANHGDFVFGPGEASDCCTDADCAAGRSCEITVDDEGVGSGTCDCPLGAVRLPDGSCAQTCAGGVGGSAECEGTEEPGCTCALTNVGRVCVAGCGPDILCPPGMVCVSGICAVLCGVRGA